MKTKYSLDDVHTVDVPETPVAVLQHRGNPALVGATIQKFIGWRRAVGLKAAASQTYNVFHSDSEITPADEFRVDICAATDRTIEPNEQGVEAGVIPAGRCAVLRAIGSENVEPAIEFLYRDWLPSSGETLRDFPLYCERVSVVPVVAEHEVVTDIFLPLAMTSHIEARDRRLRRACNEKGREMIPPFSILHVCFRLAAEAQAALPPAGLLRLGVFRRLLFSGRGGRTHDDLAFRDDLLGATARCGLGLRRGSRGSFGDGFRRRSFGSHGLSRRGLGLAGPRRLGLRSILGDGFRLGSRRGLGSSLLCPPSGLLCDHGSIRDYGC